VRRAVAVAARSGATFLTIHGVGQVMRAAIEGRGDSGLKLLAVTVLTSFDQEDVRNSATTARLPIWWASGSPGDAGGRGRNCGVAS